MRTITIKDESLTGDILNEIKLKFEEEYITVSELIESRVALEVQRYNDSVSNLQTHTLVVPSDLEKRLNDKKAKKRVIDVEKQCYVALQAFLDNSFFILVDDEQVERLEQRVLVDDDTSVSFVKLTPLVGG